ncbi:MAG: VWA domain-containing protein [Candidatus Omnitrophota bacterium]
MRFASSHLSALFWLIPLLSVFFWFALSLRRRAMDSFAEKPLLEEISSHASERGIKLKYFLTILAFILMITAFMRPQWGFKWQEVKRMGLDIVVALDVSNSMLAEDVKPNRLERSKIAIKDLVRKLKGDRIALVAFSGTAFLQCPLTLDYNGFLMAVDDVDVFSIPVGGTSISNAVWKAMETFESTPGDEKILIIVSDGEDLEGGIDRAIANAKAEGVRIFTLGMGTMEGELIPVPGERGKQGFLKDQEGNVVRTRLIEPMLQKIALETGGMYVRASGAQLGLDLMYQEELSKLQKQEFKTEMEKRYTERFQLPLGAALLLLVIELFIPGKKNIKRRGNAAGN